MGIFSFLERRVSMAEMQQELSVIAANAAPQIYFKELALQIAISYIANTFSSSTGGTAVSGRADPRRIIAQQAETIKGFETRIAALEAAAVDNI